MRTVRGGGGGGGGGGQGRVYWWSGVCRRSGEGVCVMQDLWDLSARASL